MTDPLIASLARAVEAQPEDVELRLHLATLLLQEGQHSAAVGHCAIVLQHHPDHGPARALMARGLGASASGPPVDEPAAPMGPPAGPALTEPLPPAAPAPGAFNWAIAEQELGAVGPEPMFVEDPEPAEPASAWDVEHSTVTLADVGGMANVKERLDLAFLIPMRNPELRQLYGKSLRGGLLLYGPPGCGKTFIGRALAGELGASFIAIGLSDVLDMWVGSSERNLAEIFQLARAKAPTVLFFDEIDALGARRSQTRNAGTRNTVNQLLSELDGVSTSNDGVFVIGATNQPWDVDPALRRPGRLDRTLFVSPPDEAAREAIFRTHLATRPVEGIDLRWLAKRSDGYSGADIAHVCESAAEVALLEGARSGKARMIGMPDLKAGLDQVKPSTGPWFDSAKLVVEYANPDGAYDELREWIRKNRR